MPHNTTVSEDSSTANGLVEQLLSDYRARRLANFRVELEQDWECAIASYPWSGEDLPYIGRSSVGKWTVHFDEHIGPWNLKISPWVTQTICNKTTILYIQSIHQSELTKGQKYCLSKVGDVVFNEWFKPPNPQNIDFDFYFAKPIHIKTSADSPSSVQELIGVHRKMCETVTEKMYAKAEMDFQNDAGFRRRLPPHRAHNYRVLPLCRAVIAILDQLNTLQEDGTSPRPNVLLVRTGNEERLSKPIDFAPLVHDALPLGRSDLPSSALGETTELKGLRAIRVPLEIAVRFLYDLQLQEQVACSGLYAHLTRGGDCWKNPHLTRAYTGYRYHPRSEEDFLREVHRDDMYSDGGEKGDWIQRARKRQGR